VSKIGSHVKTTGYWKGTGSIPVFDPNGFSTTISRIREPMHIVLDPANKMLGIATGGTVSSEGAPGSDSYPLVGTLPPLYPEWLGDREFQKTHKTRFAYVGGAMAHGITSTDMVISLAKAGMIGFFGSAGMPVAKLEEEITKIKEVLDPLALSFGSNLIHSPQDLALEDSIIDLYLKLGVKRVSASAFMNMSKSIVRYACKGLHKDAQGNICHSNYVFAKISRPEVARHFMSPAPEGMLKELVAEGKLTEEEAALAAKVPLAEDVTVEADSGGHTDNRPLTVLFSSIAKLRQEVAAQQGYTTKIRLGAAGGLGTPESIAAAFALGASYVMLGSVHQACVESGTSQEVKKMLATACMTDTMMCASAALFELGGRVQVLKKGVLMGIRGNQLYELYRKHASIEDIPQKDRENIEKNIFREPLDSVWQKTKDFFMRSEMGQKEMEKAERDPKHKMALVFRSYMGQSSRWAIVADPAKRLDYQIWCGPAIGSFNDWVKGTFLEQPEDRKVAQVALNLMEGAAMITKAQQLRTYGLPVLDNAFSYTPVNLG
jgi:PfaD family protein